MEDSYEICNMELEKDLEGNSEYENLSNIEKNEIENNNKPLLKLDFNALANAKKIAQQDISDEDNWENISDTESETEYNEELQTPPQPATGK